MTSDEKTMWNRKYSEGSHGSLDPDPFLVSAYEEFLSRRAAGEALDLAGGAGRHTLWLAERGWRVKLLDISEVGIQLAQQNVSSVLEFKGSPSLITTEVTDLNQLRDFGEQYDLILVFFYLQRELFPALTAALKPGGFLIYKTYTTEQRRFSGGPSHPMFLLEPNELLHGFQQLRILHYHETVAEKGVAELVGKKPPAPNR